MKPKLAKLGALEMSLGLQAPPGSRRFHGAPVVASARIK
jgi:hypothetical protein